MNWTGATRKQADKRDNDDAFAIYGDTTILLDGAGNAQGKAARALRTLRTPLPPLQQLAKQLHTVLLGFGIEATFIGAQVTDKVLSGISIGNSLLYYVRDGKLQRINNATKTRLGSPSPELSEYRVEMAKHDCILLASDGLTLDKYRLVETIKRNMLNPAPMAEAILQAQRDGSDDVTVVCRVM